MSFLDLPKPTVGDFLDTLVEIATVDVDNPYTEKIHALRAQLAQSLLEQPLMLHSGQIEAFIGPMQARDIELSDLRYVRDNLSLDGIRNLLSGVRFNADIIRLLFAIISSGILLAGAAFSDDLIELLITLVGFFILHSMDERRRKSNNTLAVGFVALSFVPNLGQLALSSVMEPKIFSAVQLLMLYCFGGSVYKLVQHYKLKWGSALREKIDLLEHAIPELNKQWVGLFERHALPEFLRTLKQDAYMPLVRVEKNRIQFSLDSTAEKVYAAMGERLQGALPYVRFPASLNDRKVHELITLANSESVLNAQVEMRGQLDFQRIAVSSNPLLECHVCGATQNIGVCTHCRATFYCKNSKCQAADYSMHIGAPKGIAGTASDMQPIVDEVLDTQPEFADLTMGQFFHLIDGKAERLPLSEPFRDYMDMPFLDVLQKFLKAPKLSTQAAFTALKVDLIQMGREMLDAATGALGMVRSVFASGKQTLGKMLRLWTPKSFILALGIVSLLGYLLKQELTPSILAWCVTAVPPYLGILFRTLGLGSISAVIARGYAYDENTFAAWAQRQVRQVIQTDVIYVSPDIQRTEKEEEYDWERLLSLNENLKKLIESNTALERVLRDNKTYETFVVSPTLENPEEEVIPTPEEFRAAGRDLARRFIEQVSRNTRISAVEITKLKVEPQTVHSPTAPHAYLYRRDLQVSFVALATDNNANAFKRRREKWQSFPSPLAADLDIDEEDLPRLEEHVVPTAPVYTEKVLSGQNAVLYFAELLKYENFKEQPEKNIRIFMASKPGRKVTISFVTDNLGWKLIVAGYYFPYFPSGSGRAVWPDTPDDEYVAEVSSDGRRFWLNRTTATAQFSSLPLPWVPKKSQVYQSLLHQQLSNFLRREKTVQRRNAYKSMLVHTAFLDIDLDKLKNYTVHMLLNEYKFVSRETERYLLQPTTGAKVEVFTEMLRRNRGLGKINIHAWYGDNGYNELASKLDSFRCQFYIGEGRGLTINNIEYGWEETIDYQLFIGEKINEWLTKFYALTLHLPRKFTIPSLIVERPYPTNSSAQ